MWVGDFEEEGKLKLREVVNEIVLCLSPVGTLFKNLGHRPKPTRDVPLRQITRYFQNKKSFSENSLNDFFVLNKHIFF